MTRKNRNKLLAGAAVAVVVIGGGAGGWYALGHGGSPLARADQLLAKGDTRGAQIELRNAVRQEPNSPQAHLKLAQLQQQSGDPVAAEKEFKTALDLGADRWEIIPQLGQVYMAQNRFSDVLTEVPPEGPTPEIAAKNLILRAMAQVGTNDIAAATATLTQAEKAAPGNVDVLVTSARLALALKDYETAGQKVSQALAASPKQVDALLMKAQVLLAQDKRPEALEVLNQVVAEQPGSSGGRLERANQLMLSGEDEKAMEDVKTVLKDQPRNAAATYLYGVLLVRNGKYADAQTELEKLGPVVQRFPRALYFQALSALNLGQSQSAIEFANRYVGRVPNDPDGVRLVARAELAAQRPDRAVAVLEKAINGSNKDPQMLDLLGRAYAAMGRGPQAIETFKRAAEAAPNDAAILTHLASTEMQVGDASGATSTIERSIEIAPQQPNAGEALVAAALSAGDIDKAQAALDRLRAQVGETEAVGILTGMVSIAKLDLDGGRVAFADTVKRFPDSVNAKLNLAKVLVLENRRPEGEALLRELLAKNPADVPALSAAVQLMVQQQQFPQAIQLVEAARAAQPKNLGFTAMLSDLIVRSGDPRRAVGLLLAMRSTEDLTPPLVLVLARAQEAAGLLDDAKTTYSDLLKATPTDLDARRGQVDLMLRNKELQPAEASLRDALKLAPGNVGLMTALVQVEFAISGSDGAMKVANELRADTANLPNSTVLKGDLLMSQRRYADAAQAFEAEYKLSPTEPLVLRIANALASAGQDDQAATAVRTWLRDHPTDADSAQVLALFDVKARRLDDAEHNLGIVLASRPSNPIALNNLAWVYQQKNDPRARVTAQRAYLQAPTPESGDTLGWIMVTSGDAKAGLPLLTQASTQRPDDPTIKYHLAVAMKDMGQQANAVTLLQPIVSSILMFDDKDAARKLLASLTPSK